MSAVLDDSAATDQVTPTAPDVAAATDGHDLAPLPEGPNIELYFGIVRAIGTPTDALYSSLDSALRRARFYVQPVRVSDAIRNNPILSASGSQPDDSSQAKRYLGYMSGGDLIRATTEKPDALAIEAVGHLSELRFEARREAESRGLRGIAYILRNLMHPAEVRTLRRIYRQQFFVVSLFAPEDLRISNLSRRLANGDEQQSSRYEAEATKLVKRDSGVIEPATDEAKLLALKPYILNVASTYHLADLFVDARDVTNVKEEVDRFVELLFSNPFRTPTRNEVGMGHAYQAALQTSNLSRCVGAAIAGPMGDLIATGTNEVPRAEGGVYCEGDDRDNRDVAPHRGYDTSDRIRRSVLADLVQRLTVVGLLEGDPDNVSSVVDSLIRNPLTREAQFFDILEFGRTLHAEMDAIVSAARRGVSLADSTLFCTTLPCHECARLIIAAQIKRVVFVEPFEKTRALDLFREELHVASVSQHAPPHDAVSFMPYTGISPRRFFEFFSWVDRKRDDILGRDQRTLDGAQNKWDPATADVRESIAYMGSLRHESRLNAIRVHESREFADYQTKLNAVQEAARSI